MIVRPSYIINRLSFTTRAVHSHATPWHPPAIHHRTFTKSSPFNMKEAIVSKGLKVTIHDVPIPKPNADQLLIKLIYSGSNPKDWKMPQLAGIAQNSGDDIAGIVEEVGENVVEFKKGDRVAAFHEMRKPHGSFAEYGIAWAYTTFHLPKKISFEEGATIPLAAMTAAVGLYLRLGLPEPWAATTTPIPLIVYGGSSAVGAYTIKLAQASNIHPLIVVAGKGIPYVETLLTPSKGDAIVDYRNGDEAVVSGIQAALQKAGASEVKYAFDAVSEKGSFQNISKVLAKEGSKITLVLPGADYSDIPDYISHNTTTVGTVHQNQEKQATTTIRGKDFGHVYFRLFSKGLQEGWFTPHPYTIIPGGLEGVEEGLTNLMLGKASATKYIFKIGDTK